MKRIDKFTIDGYTIHSDRYIGGGAFGEVYDGESNTTKEEVAVKIINIKNLPLEQLNKIKKNEIQLVKTIEKHPNIVSIIDTRQNAEFFYIILEKCDSDLDNFISIKKSKKQQISEQIAVWIIFQIYLAFKHLQKSKILHRDLKPANILIKDGMIKVADFGLSKQISTRSVCKNTARTGTPHYMSLEVLKGKIYTDKCDVWSLGCILYVLLHEQLPWCMLPEAGMIQAFQNYRDDTINIPREKLSEGTRNLLQACLRLEEHDRPSWKLLSSFFRNKKQMVQNSTKYQKQIKYQLQNCNNKYALLNEPSLYGQNLKNKTEKFQQIQLLKKLNQMRNQKSEKKLQLSPFGKEQKKQVQKQEMVKNQIIINQNEIISKVQENKNLNPKIQLQQIEKSQDWKKMIKMLDELDKNVTEINFSSDKISADGFKAFTAQAANFKNLTEIHFSNNNIGDDGIKAFAAQAANFKNLTRIDFGQNSISDDGFKAFIAQAANFKNLTYIYFGYNKIGDNGFKAFTAQAANFKNLTGIYFNGDNCSSNKISKSLVQAFKQSFKPKFSIGF